MYISFGNFFLVLNFDSNRIFLIYGLPSLLSFITIIIQIRIIYFVFIKRNEALYTNNYQVLKKKILQFYTLYHVFAFFLILKSIILFVDEKFIIIMACLYYTPVLIANLFNDRLKKIPLVISLSYFVNRFLLSFYLKLDENNIYNVHTNKNLVFLVITIYFIQEFIYYIQIFIGGKSMLPMFIRKKLGHTETNSIKEIEIFEISKYENIAKNKNCPICVTNFNEDEENESIDNVISVNKDNNNYNVTDNSENNIVDKETDRSFNSILHIKDDSKLNSNDKSCSPNKFNESNSSLTFNFNPKNLLSFSRNFLKVIYIVLFKFHDLNDINKCSVNKNSSSKLLLTNCGHLYHKTCLLEWLDVKRVCPMDKLPIDS